MQFLWRIPHDLVPTMALDGRHDVNIRVGAINENLSDIGSPTFISTASAFQSQGFTETTVPDIDVNITTTENDDGSFAVNVASLPGRDDAAMRHQFAVAVAGARLRDRALAHAALASRLGG